MTQQSQPAGNPPPPVHPDVLTGLEHLRSMGDRDDELYLSAGGAFFEEAFMTSQIITAEENTKFIKKIEALVRGSVEYKMWIGYLRSTAGLNRCSFFSGLDMAEGDISLEMHHAPLTLYEIVDIVVSHRMAKGQAVTSMSVADEVMRMHMDDCIGVVPLSISVHKLVHSGALKLHPAMVHGDWLEFLRSYAEGVSEEVVERLLRFVATEEDDVAEAARKIDASQAHPRLRADVRVPSADEVHLLLMAPRGA